jgi:hypothetical protein
LGMKACRMRTAFQPGPDAHAVVAGEDNGDDHDLAARIRVRTSRTIPT